LVVCIDAQNRFPCCAGGVHASKTVMVSSDLEASIKMVAIASHRRFEVRQSVVNLVEMHVVKSALVPRSCMVRRLTEGFIERGLGTFGTVHAHVAGRQLGKGMRVVWRLLQDMLEFL
jgi:hypothetical protein